MPAKKEEVDLRSLRTKLNEAKERIQDLEKNFEHKIQEKPVQSVLISFGVGFLSGALVYAIARSR